MIYNISYSGGCGIEIEDSYVVTGGFNFFKHFENQNRMLQEDKFYKDVIDGLKTVTRYNRKIFLNINQNIWSVL